MMHRSSLTETARALGLRQDDGLSPVPAENDGIQDSLPELDTPEFRYREACVLLDGRIEDLDALSIAHHRDRIAWHADRLRDLGEEVRVLYR